jgi:hypothetical protein
MTLLHLSPAAPIFPHVDACQMSEITGKKEKPDISCTAESASILFLTPSLLSRFAVAEDGKSALTHNAAKGQ